MNTIQDIKFIKENWDKRPSNWCMSCIGRFGRSKAAHYALRDKILNYNPSEGRSLRGEAKEKIRFIANLIKENIQIIEEFNG